MKKLFSIIIISLALFGCKSKNQQYTIEGRLMSSCTTPSSNKKILLAQEKGLLTIGGALVKEFTCDENGYFKVMYNPKNGGKITLKSSGRLIENIPSHKNIQLGIVYFNPPPVNFKIRLQVNNPYTSSDTLYYYDWNFPQNGASHWEEKIAGPFQSGIIDSVINASYMDFPFRYGENPEMNISYYVNDFQLNKRDAKVIVTPCSETFSEAVLTID